MMQESLKTVRFWQHTTMEQKTSNTDMSRFDLGASDATLIVAIVGFVCYLLGFFMGIIF